MWGCTFWFPHASSRGWWVGWDVKHTCSFPLPLRTAMRLDASFLFMASAMCSSQLSAMDVSVRATMKGAAKCDKHCELQNSVNRQGLERILCSRGFLSACLVQCLCFAFRPFVVELASAAGCELLGFRRCALALLRLSMHRALQFRPAY